MKECALDLDSTTKQMFQRVGFEVRDYQRYFLNPMLGFVCWIGSSRNYIYSRIKQQDILIFLTIALRILSIIWRSVECPGKDFAGQGYLFRPIMKNFGLAVRERGSDVSVRVRGNKSADPD